MPVVCPDCNAFTNEPIEPRNICPGCRIRELEAVISVLRTKIAELFLQLDDATAFLRDKDPTDKAGD